jgi:hypothetical protein
MVSSKNIDLFRGASFERGKSRVTGEDIAHWIVFFPQAQLALRKL